MSQNKFVKNIFDASFVVIVVGWLICGFIKSLVFPSDINHYENRNAYKLELPSIYTYIDRSFQDNTENALSDQVVYAKRLKQLYNNFVSVVTIQTLIPIADSTSAAYIKLGSHYLYNGDTLLYPVYDKSSTLDNMAKRASAINSLYCEYPNIDFYVYYIEKDTDINFETGETLGASDELFSNLEIPGNNVCKFSINNFDEFKTNFYSTDHHWNADGSYKAYCQLLPFLGLKDACLEQGEKKLISVDFGGSKTITKETTHFKEHFYVYEYAFTPMKIKCNGAAIHDYGNQYAFINGTASDKVSYGNFYGGDYGELIFDTGDISKENILVVGESYDNAILKLLAGHFNRTHSVDLRYYKDQMGKEFDFSKYVSDNAIDKVLFIGNVDFYNSDVFEVK